VIKKSLPSTIIFLRIQILLWEYNFYWRECKDRQLWVEIGIVCRDLCSVLWFEIISSCLFCWYWWNCWPSLPTGAGHSTFSYLILNCKQYTKLYILLTCQQIGVNTFYKCIEFQVNNFDSYWEIRKSRVSSTRGRCSCYKILPV
jgi:hypothetical protein